jgi:hypothetical protein
MANQSGIQISLTVKECKCTKFELTPFALNNRIAIGDDKYEFEFKVQFSFDEANELIVIRLTSTLRTNDNPKENIAELNTSNIFLVQNFKNIIVKIGDNPPAISDAFIMHLLSISMSALRGMYAVKLEPTIYSNAIMPIVDVVQMMNLAAPLNSDIS